MAAKAQAFSVLTDKDIELKKSIRVAGIVTIIVGILQLGITVSVYIFFDSPKNGCFWAAFFVILTGLIALFCINKGVVMAAWAMSLCSTAIALAATILDSQAGDLLWGLRTCVMSSNLYDVDNYVYSGSKDYQLQASWCLTGNYQPNKVTCYCVDSNNHCTMYFGDNSCDDVFSTYWQRLKAACGIDTLAMLCSLSVFLLSTFSLCVGRPKKAMTSREAVMSMRMGPVNPQAQGQAGVDYQANPLAPPPNMKHTPPPGAGGGRVAPHSPHQGPGSYNVQQY